MIDSRAEPSNRLARSLFPAGGARTGPVEAGVLFALGLLGAFYRLGAGAGRGALWAEDGAVFLQQAYRTGVWRSVSVQYAGYLHLVPRLVTAVVIRLPLSWQGVGVHLVAAGVQSLVALACYVALADHLSQRWARLLVAVTVIAVPVGPETTGNLANLQWYLMFGAGIVLLWTPRGRAGWTALCALVLAATMSSPFGFVILAGALLRYALVRARATLVVLGVAAAGFAGQTAAMLHAPPRFPGQPTHHQFNLVILARGYLSRVLGDGVFGVQRLPLHQPQRTITAGLLVLAAAVLLVAILLSRGRPVAGTMIGAAAALSVLSYLLPVVLAGPPLDNAWGDSRYYVTPALYAETALIVLVARATQGRRLRGRWLAGTVSAPLIGSLRYGLVDSYDYGAFGHRDTARSWADSVRIARQQCQYRPDSTVVAIAMLPAGWGSMHLTCGNLR
ncbi:MAG: hypothetical protein ACR2N4_06950 [Jatrophihabitans sp.]